MAGIPSLGGPPETISSSGTVWLEKSVRHSPRDWADAGAAAMSAVAKIVDMDCSRVVRMGALPFGGVVSSS